jgi:hypothetical protein
MIDNRVLGYSNSDGSDYIEEIPEESPSSPVVDMTVFNTGVTVSRTYDFADRLYHIRVSSKVLGVYIHAQTHSHDRSIQILEDLLYKERSYEEYCTAYRDFTSYD